jgi:hypothetical protein
LLDILEKCGDINGQLKVGGHVFGSHLLDMHFFRLIIVPGMNALVLGISVRDHIHLVHAEISQYLPIIDSVITSIEEEEIRASVRTKLIENIGAFYLARKVHNAAHKLGEVRKFGQDSELHENIYNDSHSIFHGKCAFFHASFSCKIELMKLCADEKNMDFRILKQILATVGIKKISLVTIGQKL